MDSPIFSFTSNVINGIAVSELMWKKKKWTIACLQRPPGGHLAITDATSGNWKDFVNSLKECVKDIKENPNLNENHDTAMYGMTGLVPDKRVLKDFVAIHQAAMLDTIE